MTRPPFSHLGVQDGAPMVSPVATGLYGLDSMPRQGRMREAASVREAPPFFGRGVSHFLMLAAGAAMCFVTAGAVAAPNQPPPSLPEPSLTPSATIADGTIAKAGAALRDVANVQQRYQPQIETASPAQKQDLVEKAAAEGLRAIRSHDLSVQEFATVARTAQTDQRVRQRLLDAARQE